MAQTPRQPAQAGYRLQQAAAHHHRSLTDSKAHSRATVTATGVARQRPVLPSELQGPRHCSLRLSAYMHTRIPGEMRDAWPSSIGQIKICGNTYKRRCHSKRIDSSANFLLNRCLSDR
ncbi:hypothetical protein E4U19_008181 [Claviceps sp. Clav32 group G5]|nr:hypothetical protein E4U19_008181 [Claviceps sp. Clav32 group G5]